eukprot:CAMPEP_0170571906 /NCGR_PEP_ID=MMETSP0224-20130122/1932_1 /TAXON_ID=285029 /ORGANISM="Togula jolla, Strain CCCM 725" /LENGTH=169 /DNA_ID=CAMNT_0010894359 /DNA_START=111 /DNA_END=620 /DNA_ORIENTATION=-
MNSYGARSTCVPSSGSGSSLSSSCSDCLSELYERRIFEMEAVLDGKCLCVGLCCCMDVPVILSKSSALEVSRQPSCSRRSVVQERPVLDGTCLCVGECCCLDLRPRELKVPENEPVSEQLEVNENTEICSVKKGSKYYQSAALSLAVTGTCMACHFALSVAMVTTHPTR